MFDKLKAFLPFSKKIKPPEKSENLPTPPLTALTSQINSLRAILGVAEENPDEVLKRKGVKIYDEMEEKDPHLYSVYQTRKLAVSRIPWEIVPASQKKKQDQEIAEFVFAAIDNSKGIFSEDIFQLMDAVGKGFSVLEIIWKNIKKGKWIGKFAIDELVFHPQKYWAFQDRKYSGKARSKIFFKTDYCNSQEVPWSKIIHYAFDAQDSLYGRAAFKSCYWHWWFKKESWKWWICFEGSTKVFVNSSLKAISEVRPGDQVLTEDGKFREVQLINKRPFQGELLKIASNLSLPFSCTPNHRFLAVRTQPCPHASLLTCKERKNPHCDHCSLKFWKNYKTEWIPACQLKKGDFLVFNPDIISDDELPTFYVKSWNHVQPGIRLNYSAALLRLCGWYLSEGCFEKRDGIPKAIQITTPERFYDEFLWISKELGISVRKDACKHTTGCHRFRFFSSALALSFQKAFSEGAIHKQIPISFLQLDKYSLLDLLRGLFRGDGNYSEGNRSISLISASDSITAVTSLILRKLGFRSSITQKHFSSDSVLKTGQIIHHNKEIYLQVNVSSNISVLGDLLGDRFINVDSHNSKLLPSLEGFDLSEIKHIKKIPFSGDVFNLQVADKHSYSLPFCIASNCYLEKYAGPTAVGKYPMGSSKAEQDKLLSLLESIQQETAVVLPDHLAVSFMEASRSGAASYREMCDACNAEESKAVLGATQTVEEGRRGSYSLSRAHSQVRQERVEADGMAVADIIQQQLVKPLVDFNFLTESYPQFILRYPVGTIDKRKGKTFETPKYLK